MICDRPIAADLRRKFGMFYPVPRFVAQYVVSQYSCAALFNASSILLPPYRSHRKQSCDHLMNLLTKTIKDTESTKIILYNRESFSHGDFCKLLIIAQLRTWFCGSISLKVP